MTRPRPKPHGQLLRYAASVGVRHEKVAAAIEHLEALRGKLREAHSAVQAARNAVEHAEREDLDRHARAIADGKPTPKATVPRAQEALRDAEATRHATEIALERAESDLVRLVDVHRDELWAEAQNERDAAEIEGSTALGELEKALDRRHAALRELYWLACGKAVVPPVSVALDGTTSPAAIIDELRRLFTVHIERPDSMAGPVSTTHTAPPADLEAEPSEEAVSVA